MLDVGAADGRGALGAQRQRAPAGVVEGEHLLAHDVGGLADAAGEQLGRLEGGRLDPLVAGALEQRARASLERGARLSLLAEHVEGAARGFELGRAQRPAAVARRDAAARGTRARSSVRNGLVSRSRQAW